MPLEQLLSDSPRALEVLQAAAAGGGGRGGVGSATAAAGGGAGLATATAKGETDSDTAATSAAGVERAHHVLGQRPAQQLQQQQQQEQQEDGDQPRQSSGCVGGRSSGFALQSRAIHVYNEAARVQRFRQVGRGVE